MRIKLTSVFVDDQEKALTFYIEVLGFVEKTELPAERCETSDLRQDTPVGTELSTCWSVDTKLTRISDGHEFQ